MVGPLRFVTVVSCLVLGWVATGVAGSRPASSGMGGEPGEASVVPGVVVFKIRGEGSGGGSAALQTRSRLGDALRQLRVSGVRPFLRGSAAGTHAALHAGDALLKDIYIGDLPAEADPRQVARMLARQPDVVYAEPKYVHALTDIPNDPLLFNQNEAFTRLNAYNGWTIGKGAASVPIAVIDGGTFWRHEDLAPNLFINSAEDINVNGAFDPADVNGVDEDGNGFVDDVVGWNFTNGTNDPSGLPATPRSYAHGTATASHFGAVADNGIGMTGSSWNCSLLPVCVASSSGDNLIAFGYEGIVYAYQRGAKVINCSWGRGGGFSQFEQDVIAAANAAGALVVAAAGNENTNVDVRPHYPSSYRGVLGVGATESVSDVKAAFSNYGMNVPVYAPGVSIFSAFPGGGYGNGGSGTSYSSPLVAGLAGILRSQYPIWTPARIAAQIRTTADPIDGVNAQYEGLLGRGRVNFARALTESHPALDVVASDVRTPGGIRIFLPGDTVVLSLTLQNVTSQTATNMQFAATTSNPLLQVAAGTAALALAAPGETVQVPPFLFVVGSVSSAREVVMRIRWTINGLEQDGAAFRATLFPSVPQWVMQLDGAGSSLFSVYAVNRSVVWAAGGNSVGTAPLVVRSTDGGETWLDKSGTLTAGDLYCVTALDENRAWAGTGDGDIVATFDGGAMWAVQPYPGRQSPFINGVRMFADGTGFSQGDPPGDNTFVVLKTTDFGVTWTHLAAEPVGVSGEASWNNSFWWTDSRHGWFGTNKNKVWRTTNGGESWSSAPTGGTNSFGVAFRDSLLGYAVHDAGNLARSTNGGQSWVTLGSPTTEMLAAVTTVPATSSAWFVTGSSPWRTRTDGSQWQAETLFPFTGSLNHLSFADTTAGWTVTSNGEILKYAPGLLTSASSGPGGHLPVTHVLEQNYPNPFNPATRIRYSVGSDGGGPETATVRLAVYDLLGREVAVLVDEAKSPGWHEALFDAAGLASGVYIVRMTVRSDGGGISFASSQRMVLIR